MQNRPPFWACAVALAAALACHAAQAQQSVQSVQSAPSDAVDEAGDGEAGNTLQAVTVKAVGDWLGSAEERNVQNHPGARNVIRRAEMQQEGLTTVREALNRIPGVHAPENNGTGSHDMALNIGIRGLNPRLASRSTLLMDGIPVPYAPYGQPQMSFGPVSLGLMDAVDVVRGGGAVRYGRCQRAAAIQPVFHAIFTQENRQPHAGRHRCQWPGHGAAVFRHARQRLARTQPDAH